MAKLVTQLREGRTALGTHVSLNDPAITELMGGVGFDYLWIDTEHTSISLHCLEQHLIAARAAGVSAIVRVPCVDPIRVKPILEMGPDGIIFPQVNSREEAELAVASCRYPPMGIRGYGPRRAIGFDGANLPEYFEKMEKDFLRILQIENIKAVENLDEILQVEGISAFIMGPCDLAASMGYLGNDRHPEVRKVIEDVFRRVKKAGIPIGVSYGACKPEDAAYWRDLGVNMISLVADTDYIMMGSRQTLNMMKDVF